MTSGEKLTVKLNDNDNVATALRNIEAGETTQNVKSLNKIPKGHKISLRKINKGEKIIKYDQLIGIASKDILVGDHVHVENTDFKSTDHDYEYSTSIKLPNMIEPEKRPTFKGYKRPNGKVGTRNYIGILTSVNCSATAARNIAEVFTKDKLSQYPNVDGVVSFTHGTGCGMADSGTVLRRVTLAPTHVYDNNQNGMTASKSDRLVGQSYRTKLTCKKLGGVLWNQQLRVSPISRLPGSRSALAWAGGWLRNARTTPAMSSTD